MALRRSRNLTFIDGVTQVPADLMNKLQDDNVDDEERIRGFGFTYRDDFVQNAMDAAVWSNSLSNIDDSANGGFGTVRANIALASADNTDTTTIFPIDDHDFRLCIRVRIADKSSGGGGYFFFGFKDAGIGDFFGFEVVDTQANWCTVLSILLTRQVSTIPVSTTDYANLEIERIGSTVTMYINGTAVRTLTGETTFDPQVIRIAYQNGVDSYIDLVSLSVDR